jgi:DNA-binding CsgD family transcriptional regulator
MQCLAACLAIVNEEFHSSRIISPRTINVHLNAIYAKLGVSSRSAATRFALEQHLV